jgi:hypothetical protein
LFCSIGGGDGAWWWRQKRDGGGGACYDGSGGIGFFIALKNVCPASTVVHDSVLFDFKIVCHALRLPHG